MELDRLKILADKYFEAETTLDEERELRELTANMEDIPEEYAALKIILCVTTANQEVKVPEAKHEVKHRNRWILPIIGGATIAAAAAAIVIMLTTPLSTTESITTPAPKPTPTVMHYDIVCHVNGVQLTNMDDAYSQANRILGGVANDMELAMAQIQKLNIQSIK